MDAGSKIAAGRMDTIRKSPTSIPRGRGGGLTRAGKNEDDTTHHGSENPQHILDDRPDVVRLPLLPRGIRGLEVGHDVHDVLEPRRQHPLLVLELGDEVVDVGHGALGFDAPVGLRQDGGDLGFGHDQVEGGGRRRALLLFVCACVLFGRGVRWDD